MLKVYKKKVRFIHKKIFFDNNRMPSIATIYRQNHPENYEKEKVNNKIRNSERYKNDPEYKEKKRQYALDRYYRLKSQNTAE